MFPEWKNTTVNVVNVEKPHAAMVSRTSSRPVSDPGLRDSPNVLILDGTWKFHYSPTSTERPYWFFRNNFDTRVWDDIKVPSSWEREGYGTAYYINHGFALENDPLIIDMEKNPVGSYKRSFKLPIGWKKKEVFLNFDGVSSAYYVWVNGEKIGYSEDSKTTAEFNITRYLKRGENQIAVEVYRWCDGSYLEDHDFWRLSGISRSVWLHARPKVYIRDYFAQASLDSTYNNGLFDIDIDIVNITDKAANTTLKITLFDRENKTVTIIDTLAEISAEPVRSYSAGVKEPRKWSAENPNLYDLVITLYDNKGKILESIMGKIGFRTTEVKGTRFLVNGEPVYLKGVNLHEHHPLTGQVVDEATIYTDIKLMKENNINAVRTSYYPHSIRFYELADIYGLYIISEANIESHDMDYRTNMTPGNKSERLDQIMLRSQRMVELHKNHPSIVIWSLGNAAGEGSDFVSTFNWVKERDDSRPVQYEKDEIENYPNLQGRFISNWVDHGLLETAVDGTEFFAYGGDNICPNGLVDPNRKENPALAEVKKKYQNVNIDYSVDDKLITITNKYFFTSLLEFDFIWTLLSEDEEIASGICCLLDIDPGMSADIEFSVDTAFIADDTKEYFLNIDMVSQEGWGLIPAGHILASELFSYK